MVYGIFIDRETGECVDEPVSEVRSLRVFEISVSNAETGEPEGDVSTEGHRRRVPFQV